MVASAAISLLFEQSRALLATSFTSSLTIDKLCFFSMKPVGFDCYFILVLANA
jgi:hypothetical protein